MRGIRGDLGVCFFPCRDVLKQSMAAYDSRYAGTGGQWGQLAPPPSNLEAVGASPPKHRLVRTVYIKRGYFWQSCELG